MTKDLAQLADAAAVRVIDSTHSAVEKVARLESFGRWQVESFGRCLTHLNHCPDFVDHYSYWDLQSFS